MRRTSGTSGSRGTPYLGENGSPSDFLFENLESWMLDPILLFNAAHCWP